MSALPKIYSVGIGPGSHSDMTFRAHEAIEKSDVVVGYKTYIDLVREYFPDKVFEATGMMQETERVRRVIELALSGKTVALCCSGDAGVYALTALLYEECDRRKCFDSVEISSVSGVTAAVFGGAALGSPLTNDYVSISLSDRLTEYETIKKRTLMAAQADMVTVLYNPKSKGRPGHLERLCEVFLEYRSEDTVCGIAKRIGRENETAKVLSLGELKTIAADPADDSIDMQTVVFIGNSDTVKINGKMITKRGYHKKYE